MLESPYTRWQGDDLHGRHPVLTPVWVRLDALYRTDTNAPRHVIPTGLDLSGTVSGLLHGWFPMINGTWLGVVNFHIPYADGRTNKLSVNDQLVPDYMLKPRL